jgi:hypothetical protein
MVFVNAKTTDRLFLPLTCENTAPTGNENPCILSP